MTTFSIGCDPELFLLDKKGAPMSAHGVVGGTKREPLKVACGAIQVDGMALEFNTDPAPLKNGFNVFNTNIVTVIAELKKAVRENGYKTARFNIVPVQDFGEELMAEQPDEAKELGCDPDWNAYTKEVNPRPDGEVSFRTASGHIHVGWGADIPAEHPDHIEICADFIKKMDATVGLFMTLIDTDPRRRELYGKAGAFRPKPYGVEYRTPSNLWLTNVSRRRIIYGLVNLAIKLNQSVHYQFHQCCSGKVLWESDDMLKDITTDEQAHELVQKTINNGDTERARKILWNILGTYQYDFTSLRTLVRREYKRTLEAAKGMRDPSEPRPHDHIIADQVAKEMKIA